MPDPRRRHNTVPAVQPATSGVLRLDTADRCGNTDKGFGLLVNWNLLGWALATLIGGIAWAS